MDLSDIFTNPPSHNDLLLGTDRFSCRGTEYVYSMVKSARFYAGQITHHRNFKYVTTSYETEFDIYLHKNPKPIRIRPKASTVDRFYAEYSQKQQDDICSVYQRFRGKTFLSRLEGYLEMLGRYGCFIYDGKRLFPDGRVTDGKQTFNLPAQSKNGKLIREPFKLYVELPKSLIGKIAHRLAQRDVGLRCN